MLGRLCASSLLGLVLAVSPGGADAQSPTDDGAGRPRVLVRGSVRDSKGAPIARATIVARGLSLSVTSNDSGLFAFGPLPVGPREFEIRRLGYQPIVFQVDLPRVGPHEIDIELEPVAQTLAGVETRRAPPADLASTGFFTRRRRYAGATFIAPEEAQKRNASFASQILESVPGVELRGSVGRKRVLLRNGCDMAVFVDRRFVRSGRDRRGIEWGYFDDLVDAPDIYAVEVYTRPPPPDFLAPEFPNQQFCGAIVIWTRLYMGR
jgi:Carboxypeptidase regulatory-like domain